jgi:hypothetical protein
MSENDERKEVNKTEKPRKKRIKKIFFPAGYGSTPNADYGVDGIPRAFVIGRDERLNGGAIPKTRCSNLR